MSISFSYITQPEQLPDLIDSIEASQVWALDTETYTDRNYDTHNYVSKELRTNAHTGYCSLLALHSKELQMTYVLDFVTLKSKAANLRDLAAALSTRQKLIAHNAKFDAQILTKDLGEFTNWSCTYTLAQIYANATGSKLWQVRGMKLADLCRDWLNVNLVGKGSLQISEWYCDPQARHLNNLAWLEKLNYAAADVVYLIDLEQILMKLCCGSFPPTLLESEKNNGSDEGIGLGLRKVVLIENRLIPIVASLETTGLPYNPILGKLIEAALKNNNQDNLLAVCKILNLPTTTDGVWGEIIPTNEASKLLNSAVKVMTLLKKRFSLSLSNTQTALIDRASTLLKHLEQDNLEEVIILDSENDLIESLLTVAEDSRADSFKFLDLYLKYKVYSKQISMFLSAYVNPKSQRIHSNFSPLRAATSRFASSRPNIQQVSARIALEIDISLEELETICQVSNPALK